MSGCGVGGFKATDRARLAQKRAQAAQAVANVPQDVAQMNTIEFALKTHRCFKTIAIFLIGMFSGITIWHIVASYMLIIAGYVVFMKHYFMLALPVQCVYYFMFAVATVYTLDRYVCFLVITLVLFVLVFITLYSLHHHQPAWSLNAFFAECCNCIAKFCYSHDMSSVCLSSVTLMCCDKTTGHRITQFSLQNS